ncbi:hypothetical protein SCAR479_00012 [Seiridium cardinale]|uniref:VOC domain-containing protein n=1 Tax=Seiridium cardinale TaxID=138064 RepID=A0ABR2Y8B6_9PEZI
MPISHVSLATGASKWAAMRSFYLTALAPLGYTIYFEKENYMLGLKPSNGVADFWIHTGNDEQVAYDGTDVENRPGRAHVAFNVESQEDVDKFYNAAMYVTYTTSSPLDEQTVDIVLCSNVGGVSNGGPGLRPQYASSYYAAFVLDPLGNNIEAIHYSPQKSS